MAWVPSPRSRHFSEQPTLGLAMSCCSEGRPLLYVPNAFSVHYPYRVMKAHLCDSKILKSSKRRRNKKRGSAWSGGGCKTILQSRQLQQVGPLTTQPQVTQNRIILSCLHCVTMSCFLIYLNQTYFYINYFISTSKMAFTHVEKFKIPLFVL